MRRLLAIALLVSPPLGCSSGDSSTTTPDAPPEDATTESDTLGRDTESETLPDAPRDVAGDAALDAPSDAVTDAPVAGPCAVPFLATGPWCYRLPATTPIDPSSAAIVASIQSDIKTHFGTYAINTDTYSSPIYTVAAGAPTKDWSFNDCQGKGFLDPTFGACLKSVPTIAGMVMSKGTDGEITIWSPSLDEEWEFWVAGNTGGAWSACWGGCIKGVSKNPGIFPKGIGATASGLPLLAFLIRVDELAAKKITHAINIELPRTRATEISWPANRTDGNTADTKILIEGQRMRLDPTFDVSTLPNAAERTIAKAMQDYGIILTDTSGAVVTQAEDPRSYMSEHATTTNPYDALFEGRAVYEVLKELPLDRLQVLPKDYGQAFMK